MNDREKCQTCDELDAQLSMLQSELSDLFRSIDLIIRTLQVIQDFIDNQANYAKKVVAGHYPRLAWSFAKGLETASVSLGRFLHWLLRNFWYAEKKRKAIMAARLIQAHLDNHGSNCGRCNRLRKAAKKTTIKIEKQKETYKHLHKICKRLVIRCYKDCKEMCPTLTRRRGVPRPRFVYCKGRHQTPAVILTHFRVERPC